MPEWVDAYFAAHSDCCADVEERMRTVVEMSRLNVEHGTGGPFAAAVFDVATGRMLAPGLNMVVSAGCSVAHAEIVAIATAQTILGRHDLGAPGMPVCELIASTEPCAMCMGAIPWSGVRRLVCGARTEDASRVGFDEGDKLPDWPDSLQRRGIVVTRDVCREEAAAVLHYYRGRGGKIYNGRGGTC